MVQDFMDSKKYIKIRQAPEPDHKVTMILCYKQHFSEISLKYTQNHMVATPNIWYILAANIVTCMHVLLHSLNITKDIYRTEIIRN